MDSESLNVFLDFLKYGAIGIALALAILSYRLLSKEQEKEQVRPPMLKSIRNYFIMSIILSLFFGVTEIISGLILPENTEKVSTYIDDIYKDQLKDYDDQTPMAKANRISEFLEIGLDKKDASDCSSCEKDRVSLIAELKKLQNGFYPKVARLQQLIHEYGDNNINVDYKPEEKAKVYSLLEEIFVSIGELEISNPTIEDIRTAWKAFKGRYDANSLKYIYHSDVSHLVKAYLDKHG